MERTRLLNRPIFVIGCNRSGTTLLFRNLAEHPVVWSLYEEAQHVFYRHHPIDEQQGDRLADPPASEVAESIETALFREAHNKEVLCDLPILRHVPRKLLQRPLNRLYKRAPIRLVEKTPANSLRIPFLATLFPDARFIYLVRRPEPVISSLMEGWKYWSGTGEGEWQYSGWHYVVPPGWREWTGRSLQEICAFQWVESNRIALEDLTHCCADRFILVRHEEALADPKGEYERISDFCELPSSRFFTELINRSKQRVFTHHGSSPRKGKWMDLHGDEVESVRHIFQPLAVRLYPQEYDSKNSQQVLADL